MIPEELSTILMKFSTSIPVKQLSYIGGSKSHGNPTNRMNTKEVGTSSYDYVHLIYNLCM